MGKKILLADDSITIQKVIELTFSDEDYEVVTVGNGRLAIEKAKEVRPDIVLCDIIMPEKDGYEVCEFIKKDPSLSQVPVLLLTGAFEPFDQDKANKAGADGYLAKPFEPQALVARVKEVLARVPARAPAGRPSPAAPTPGPTRPSPPVSAASAAPPAAPEREAELSFEEPEERPASIAEEEEEEVTAEPEAELEPEPQAAAEPEAEAEPVMEAEEPAPSFAPPEPPRPSAPPPRPSWEMPPTVSAPAAPMPDFGVSASRRSENPAPSPNAPASVAAEVPVPTDMVEKIAQRVVAQVSEKLIREIAWEVIPDLAEALITKEIERIKAELQRT